MPIIRFFFALGILALTCTAGAQSYKTAAGIRVDNGFHLTVQQHVFNNWSVEGILHTAVGSEDLGLTLLAEKHRKIIFRGTNIFYGAGGHYYWKNEPARSEAGGEINSDVYGLSFIGGAEFTLGRINLAVDWKPELHLSDTGKAFDWNGASVSVRYIFAKRERKKVKDWKVWDTFGRKDNKKRR